jgi:uncharacterized small protein (DUF1192 family)
MFEDLDNIPRNAPKKPKPLDKLSIEELQDGIREMKEEIVRYEAEIVKKKAHKDAMSSLFKK